MPDIVTETASSRASQTPLAPRDTGLAPSGLTAPSSAQFSDVLAGSQADLAHGAQDQAEPGDGADAGREGALDGAYNASDRSDRAPDATGTAMGPEFGAAMAATQGPDGPADREINVGARRIGASPAQASSTQASPTQASPTQASPTQAGPTQAGPIQAGPIQTGPIVSGANDLGPMGKSMPTSLGRTAPSGGKSVPDIQTWDRPPAGSEKPSGSGASSGALLGVVGDSDTLAPVMNGAAGDFASRGGANLFSQIPGPISGQVSVQSAPPSTPGSVPLGASANLAAVSAEAAAQGADLLALVGCR